MRNVFSQVILSCALLLPYTAFAANEEPVISTFEDFQQIQIIIRDSYCPEDKHNEIQKELVEIFESDRADRATSNSEMMSNDLERRARVASIAAKACLKDENDYFTAAVIFQHGALPEHYMQAIIYASKSMELGHLKGEAMRQVAIDRYLMSLGYRQVFGSQITAPAMYKAVESEKDTTACLWPVENSINLMDDYGFGTEEYRTILLATIAAKKQQIAECSFPARDSSEIFPALLKAKI